MTSNKLKILLIPLITILMMVTSILLMLLFGFRTYDQLQVQAFRKLGYVLGNATFAVIVYYYIISWFNKRVVWSEKWLKRILLDITVVLVHSAIFISFANFAVKMGFVPHRSERVREFLYIIPLMMNSLFLVMIEMILAVEERNKLEIQVAQLEKEQINAKYGALKEQLDHHFLFNNLSVLSSLIYEDVEKADHFIQDFSATYRYVLQINQRNLVKVQEELAFIDTYLHLYKFRFEEGFCYALHVNTSHCNWMIPPLTLQVLVENAIKHNMISRQKPLCLEIYNDGDQLIVKNTIQPKQEKAVSTQTGQVNLVEKYRLLGKELPVFLAEENEYIVKIPLIAPDED
ncbi:hypothetical protein DMA11_13265 [Marinilabiliaceae bacterium JC017]|nr:hypothetical protein DMA11_13265 [Marinilabiliaceae bacterium JC017]